MSKYCLVPVTELENLEIARKKLVERYSPKGNSMGDIEKIAELAEMTKPIWHVANRGWKVVDLEPRTKEIILNLYSVETTLEELSESLNRFQERDFLHTACEALIEKIKELKNNQLNLEN